MVKEGDGTRQISLGSPRHPLRRSITDFQLPRLRRREMKAEREDRAPYSLLQVQHRRSLDGSRSEGMASNLSPTASRRASIFVANPEESTHGFASTRSQRPVSRERGTVRESPLEHLRKALADVGEISNVSSQRLDDTYSSVLEKLGMLQSTIIALKELVVSSHEIKDSFDKESQEFVADVTAQLDSFGDFDDQQKRLQALEVRIHSGRERVKTLSDRLDNVRVRIEGWEQADREWQERTRRRLKVIWVVTSVILGFLLLLLVIVQYAPNVLDDTAEATVRLANDSLNSIMNVTAKSENANALSETLQGANNSVDAKSLASDELLRVFDEL